MKKKVKRWIVLTAFLAIAAVAVVIFQGGSRQTASSFAQEIATTGSITSYYSFTGNVKVKNSQSIIASAPVTIREVYVQEGDEVLKNDRLIRTSDGETIKAGVSGEINKLHVEKNDEVTSGGALVDIVDFNNMIIEIKVDEFDISAVEAGKSAVVTVNALNRSFDATVLGLDRQATREGDISYYTAELSLGDMDGVLPGMQVDVKLLNAHVENVTILSMDALQFTETNQAYVMTQGSNGVQNIPVSLGVNDGVKVEIKDGVRSGETVLLPEKAENESVMLMGGGPGGGMGGNAQ